MHCQMSEAAEVGQARMCNFFHPEMLSTASTECPNVCSVCNNLVQREGMENSSTHVSAVLAVSELTRVACFVKLRKALASAFGCAARGVSEMATRREARRSHEGEK